MTLRNQVGVWAGVLAAATALLWVFSGILLPFIAGMVLAYFLDPAADALERRGLPRIAATSLILLTSVFVFAMMIVLVVPLLSSQVAKFAANPRDAAAAERARHAEAHVVDEHDQHVRRPLGRLHLEARGGLGLARVHLGDRHDGRFGDGQDGAIEHGRLVGRRKGSHAGAPGEQRDQRKQGPGAHAHGRPPARARG